jgi:hypothetical protein
MDFTNKQVAGSDKIFFIDGVPRLFADWASSDEHRDGWIHVLLDVNVEADAYANSDDEDHSADLTINYDCIAWLKSEA